MLCAVGGMCSCGAQSCKCMTWDDVQVCVYVYMKHCVFVCVRALVVHAVGCVCVAVRVCAWHSSCSCVHMDACTHVAQRVVTRGVGVDTQCYVCARVCTAKRVRTQHVCVHAVQPMGIPTAIT